MKEYIFKIIYVPIGVIFAIMFVGILTLMAREVGWEQPLRWLIIIGTIAYIADRIVNP